jgi:Uma2 family endonuclease
MAATEAVSIPHIPVGEYLGSVYRPDVDYVDGVLVERNVGEFDHADVQWAVRRLLDQLYEHGYRATQQTRLQVSASRHRVPDVCLMPLGWRKTQIIREAPLLCVEVLSPRDTVLKMRTRCEDYLKMGVPQLWIFDPQSRTTFVMDRAGVVERSEGALEISGTSHAIDIAAVFAVLDDE